MPEIAIYDPQGRPSCGPNSGYYEAGHEEAWVDDHGRPSVGVGSRDWWQDDGTAGFTFDRRGIPSCGDGSKMFGAEPATAAQTFTVAAITTANAGFTATVGSGGYVTRGHANRGNVTITVVTASGGLVRGLGAMWTIQDRYGFPSSRPLPLNVVVAGIIPTGTVSFAVQIPQVPTGMTADLTVSFEAFVPSGGSATVTTSIPAAPALTGPNGGTFPVVDAAGRPSCGPGSEHYLDIALVTDSLGRPSCGTGSGDYLKALVINDWMSRPSCGTGSGNAFSMPEIPAPGVIPGPVMQASPGTLTWDVVLDAGQIVANTRVDVWSSIWSEANYKPTNVTIGYLSYPKSLAGGGGTGTVAGVSRPFVYEGFTVMIIPTGAAPRGGHWWSAELPLLPTDANACGPVTVRITATAQFDGYGGTPDWYNLSQWKDWGLSFNGGPGNESNPAAHDRDFPVDRTGGVGGRFLKGATAKEGPNKGVDASCAAGPYGGVDQPCSGPNAGVAVTCAGVDKGCGVCAPGPNGGLDRVPVTECVTVTEFCPEYVIGGWPGAWTTGDLPHPASCAASTLCSSEGDRVEGLISPTGRVPWHVQFSALPAVCAGSVILSARLRARLKTPNPATWTLAAVHPATQQILGGWVSEAATTFDGTTDVLIPINVATTQLLGEMVVIGDLAAAAGGTPGWVERLTLEVQYVGGPGCRDCGPNNGTDRPCATTGAADPAPVTSAVVWGGLLTPPAASEMVPVVRVDAGTVDVHDVRIRFFPMPFTGEEPPSSDEAAWEAWNCRGACGEIFIPEMAAGEVIIIDGREDAIYSITGPLFDGSDRVFADRQLHGYRPIVLNCLPTAVLVEVLNGAVYDATSFSVTVQAAGRTLNGGA